MAAGREDGEVAAQDPEREVIALVADVGAREVVEADGIAERTVDHDVELRDRVLQQTGAAQQVDAGVARIIRERLGRIRRQRE